MNFSIGTHLVFPTNLALTDANSFKGILLNSGWPKSLGNIAPIQYVNFK